MDNNENNLIFIPFNCCGVWAGLWGAGSDINCNTTFPFSSFKTKIDFLKVIELLLLRLISIYYTQIYENL